MSLVLNIQSLCDQNNLSIPKLEKDLGFGKGSIYKWDKNFPSIDKVQKVAEFFKVSIDSLIKNENKSTDIHIDLSKQSEEFQLEIARILLQEPNMTDIIKRLGNLPPEKREVIFNLIKTM